MDLAIEMLDGTYAVARRHFGPATEATLRAVYSAASFPMGFYTAEV